jgi:hypothetical protein
LRKASFENVADLLEFLGYLPRLFLAAVANDSKILAPNFDPMLRDQLSQRGTRTDHNEQQYT